MSPLNQISDEELKELLDYDTETKHLDFKESFHLSNCDSDEDKKLIKDILAMSNIQDGGHIILGILDDSYELVGMDEEDYNSFDQTDINDRLQQYTDPKHYCHVFKKEYQENYFIVIRVPEFTDVPIICKKDRHSSIKQDEQILREGAIYTRTEKADSVEIPDASQMRNLISRAMTNRGDKLLGTIQALIQGEPIKQGEQTQEQYDDELKKSEEFFHE